MHHASVLALAPLHQHNKVHWEALSSLTKVSGHRTITLGHWNKMLSVVKFDLVWLLLAIKSRPLTADSFLS